MSHNVTLRILFMVRLILRWSAALNQITFISCDKAHVKLASLGWTEFRRYSVDSPSVPAWKPISKGPFTRTLRCELLATVAAPVESKPVFFYYLSDNSDRSDCSVARILFPQWRAIWRGKSWCHFSGTHEVCQDGKVTHSLRHVVPCHLSRISYEVFTKCVTPNVTHVHLSFVVTNRDTLEIYFLNLSLFSPQHGTHYITWPASPGISTHTVTSSFLTGTPNCVPWR